MARNDDVVAQATEILNASTAEPLEGQPESYSETVPGKDDEVEAEVEVDAGAEAVIAEGDEQATDEDEDAGGDDGPRTLKQLAEAIDVDVDYLYSIEIGMGDNQDPIPVGKLKDEYQAAVRSNTQLQEQLDGQAAEQEQAQANMQRKMEVSQETAQAQQAIQQVTKEFNDIDWPRFEREQPGEASLARQKFMERHQQATGHLQQVNNYQQQQQQQNMQDMGAKLLELMPGWRDDTVRRTEQAEVRQVLLDAGYTEATLRQSDDPVAISLIRELVSLRKQIKGAGEEVRRVRKAPKVLRSKEGRFAAPKNARAEKATQLARTSPGKHNELAAAKALLGLS